MLAPLTGAIFPSLAGGFSFGLAFFAVRWVVIFMAGRWDKKEAQLDAGTQLLLDGLKDEVHRLSEEAASLRKRVTVTEDELRDCRKRHAESEEELGRLRGLIQGRGDARNDAATIVARDRVRDKRKNGDAE